ncbi:hypothetical protein QN277_002058 [Acacia crassicarpa]|uniref:Retrotransposon Copia-like N-terminal domain-containing protein n=1 Tax=Acacia crassicarpa TaxID=499986 RepID=A0AAE1TJ54_9FABA|nr:hypothetical protein QN277_002058 [Acacia crassicarpa]
MASSNDTTPPSKTIDNSTLLHSSDNQLVSEKLNLHNYHDWARAVLLAIGGHGKRKFLTGEIKPSSDQNSPAWVQWDTDNSLVCSWLINAMSPQIKRSFMYLPTTKDIWDAVRDSYVDAKDLSQLFNLHRRIWKFSQGCRGIAEFWFELVAGKKKIKWSKMNGILPLMPLATFEMSTLIGF